jgi:predicted  nucleic acid-binding Zn-ribbon protein
MNSFEQEIQTHVQRIREQVEKLSYLNDKREKNLQILNTRINEIKQEKNKINSQVHH